MLIFSTRDNFYMISLSDDGQGDLFHPHRNHLAALHRGILYYQVTPEFYAYLRLQREALRSRAASGSLPVSVFEPLDSRFMKIREWAISHHGEMAIRAAVSSFNEKAFILAGAVYRPASGEVSVPFFAELNPEGVFSPSESPSESSPLTLPTPESQQERSELAQIAEEADQPEQVPVPPLSSLPEALQAQTEPRSQTLLVKRENGTWDAGTPVVNEPIRTVNLTPEQEARLSRVKTSHPAELAHCQSVVLRCIEEISRIYWAAEGFDTPYTWALKLSQSEDPAGYNDRVQAVSWLSDLKAYELGLETAASLALVEETDKAAVKYLASWRKIIFRYDDFITAERAKQKAVE